MKEGIWVYAEQEGDPIKLGRFRRSRTTRLAPNILRDLPSDSDIRYGYQYDNYGNWTEKIETRDDGSSFTTRRTITYY
jgi:hypothetical protein